MTMLGHAIVEDFLIAKIFVMGNSFILQRMNLVIKLKIKLMYMYVCVCVCVNEHMQENIHATEMRCKNSYARFTIHVNSTRYVSDVIYAT